MSSNINEEVAQNVLALKRGTKEYDDRIQAACGFQKLILAKQPPIWYIVRKVPEDLQAIVQHSIAHNQKLTIFAGGHSSFCVEKDASVVDLSALQDVKVVQNNGGTEENLLVLQPGLNLGQITDATSPFGLQLPMGIISHTGFGLVLGGGVGWLSRLHGLSSDHIVSFKAVDGHGESVELMGEDLKGWIGNPGANGIVYEATLRLHKVGDPFVSVFAFSLDDFATVFAKVSSFLALPDVQREPRATTYIIFDRAPTGGKCLTVVTVFIGSSEEGKAFFDPIFSLGGQVIVSASLPWPALARIVDHSAPSAYWYFFGLRVEQLSSELGCSLLANWQSNTAEFGGVILEQRGGALASSHAAYDLVFFMGVNDPDSLPRLIDEHRSLKEKLIQSNLASPTNYVNYSAFDGLPVDMTVFSQSKLKNAYQQCDPHNLFQSNIIQ